MTGTLFVFGIGWSILSGILVAISHHLTLITIPVSGLISLAMLAVLVLLMIKAYGAEKYKLPVIGDWAEKMAGGQ